MASRPKPPDVAPSGYEYVAAQEGPDWRIDRDRRCRFRVGRYACGKPSTVALLRGSVRPAWWGYCGKHRFGRWIERGFVMHWILAKVGSDA